MSDAPSAAPTEPRRGFRLPSAYSILFALIVIMAIATWIVPAGVYELTKDGSPIPGTPVRGGLSYREAHLALELVAESRPLDSLELVELNPILDRANETGMLAVELAASALGARIL